MKDNTHQVTLLYMIKENLIWSFHNLIAHPVSEICFWLGYLIPRVRDFGNWLHDWSVPKNHAEGRG